MPEGHTLRVAARKLEPLVGQVVAVEAPQPRHRYSGLREALDGRRLEAVDVRGKHLVLRFEGGRAVHSHLRMRGAWDVYRDGERWRRPASSAWLVLRGAGLVAVQFSGPVLELLDEARLRLHPALRRLGPDVLDEGFEPRAAVQRLRAGLGPADGSIADALLDQSVACGVGNVFKCEALWATRLDPWARVAELGDDEIAAVYAEARRQMLRALQSGGERKQVYGRSTCPRCGTRLQHRAQGDDGRVTWWCPACQPRR